MKKVIIIIIVMFMLIISLLSFNNQLEQDYNTKFEFKNIIKYIDYYKDNKYINFGEVIATVNGDIEEGPSEQEIVFMNVSDYQKNNLERYINYLSSNPNVEKEEIVKLVNGGIDKLNILYSPKIKLFMDDKYYIKDNLKRYLNSSLEDIRSIVELVNSNADKDFYTEQRETNVELKEQMIVNKFNHLSATYVPSDLVTVKEENVKLSGLAYDSYINMKEDAKSKGLTIRIHSGYRSYNTQKSIYESGVKASGVEYTDTVSARPGNSEHQTGLALDLKDNTQKYTKFATTEAGKWVYDNAHFYGFIERYPKGKTNITGYNYEGWHYRYVGVEIATYIYENKITFDEYYSYFLENK